MTRPGGTPDVLIREQTCAAIGLPADRAGGCSHITEAVTLEKAELNTTNQANLPALKLVYHREILRVERGAAGSSAAFLPTTTSVGHSRPSGP